MQRNLSLALILLALAAARLPAAEAPAPAAPARLTSTVFEWNNLPVQKTDTGERREVVDGPTNNFAQFRSHVTTLLVNTPWGTVDKHAEDELVIVKDGKVIHYSGNLLLSHVEFVTRQTGVLPEGARVGTVHKTEDGIVAFSSKTFYGFELPAPDWVLAAVRAMFE